jgi:hypothetical protein
MSFKGSAGGDVFEKFGTNCDHEAVAKTRKEAINMDAVRECKWGKTKDERRRTKDEGKARIEVRGLRLED